MKETTIEEFTEDIKLISEGRKNMTESKRNELTIKVFARLQTKHEEELKRAVIKAYESGFNLGGEITYKTIKTNVIPHNEYVSPEQYYKANHTPK